MEPENTRLEYAAAEFSKNRIAGNWPEAIRWAQIVREIAIIRLRECRAELKAAGRGMKKMQQVYEVRLPGNSRGRRFNSLRAANNYCARTNNSQSVTMPFASVCSILRK